MLNLVLSLPYQSFSLVVRYISLAVRHETRCVPLTVLCQFQLIGNYSDSGHDWERINISGCQFSSGLQSLDSFHRGDSEIYMFSGFEADLTVFGIIVALLS